MSGIVRAFPLTPLQEGMLYHAVRHPTSSLYRGGLEADLWGPLDRGRFEAAWARAAQRHEAFRTFFAWEKRERPLQAVRDAVELPFRWLDWSGHSTREQEDRWPTLVDADLRAPLPLDRAPLMRFSVVRLGPERHRLFWQSRHAVLDGWSAELVLGEVLEDLAGRPLPATPPPSYAEFVGWIEGQDTDAAAEWWRRELAGCPGPAPVPRIRSGEASQERRSVRRGLPTLTGPDLREATTRLKVTPATLTVAAWSLVLARESGRDDLLFGVTTSERPGEIEGVERAAGLYLSTVPVRVRITPGVTLANWVAGLQSLLVEARSRAFPGLAAIRRWTGVEPTDLVRSLVVFENFPESFEGSGDPARLRVDRVRTRGPSDLPLALVGHPAERLELELLYDPARFDEADVHRLLDDVLHTFEALAASEAAWTDVVGGWGFDEPPAADPTPGDVMAVVEDRARIAPDAPAVVTPVERLTYGELQGRVGALARSMAGQVSPGGVVALAADRSVATIVGMLAALESGVAYLPFDPEMPRARRDGILRAADAAVAHPGLDPGVIPLVSPGSGIGGAPATRPPPRPEDPAYVVFTSGSTGSPRGVVVERRHLAWSTMARFEVYDERPRAFLLLSPLSVDSAVAGIWWTLCAGGTLVLPGPRGEQDVAGLAALVAEAGVTHTLMVPSLWDAILDEADPATLASLRAVVVAGEACPASLVARHGSLLPHVPLYNEYGPTEATVWATVEELTAHGDGPVTIGRAVPGARVAVVDAGLRPVPPGVAGELVIGGAGVSRGYLDRPDRTAERFVADPERPGERLYRTGDRARRRLDGRFEFLGRMDHQLKLRGYRIEAGEVELALREHGAVAEAVVDLSPGGDSLPDPENFEALADTLLQRSPEERMRLLAAATEPR